MLQVNIQHGENDSSVKISTLYDDNVLLKEFDNETGKIDLDVCNPYIGKEIRVNHFFTDKENNYTTKGILESVDTDPSTGLKSIKYQTMGE
jgi:hypothetical protein